MKKNIGIITNARADSGVGGRAHELISHMPASADIAFHLVRIDGEEHVITVDAKRVAMQRPWPGVLGMKSIAWLRLAKKIPKFDGYDISNQSLSFIARTRQPSLITVHDVIERTDPQSVLSAPLNRYLMSGIPNAQHIVTVSEYVKRSIVKIYSIPTEHISVIYNGVGEQFAPVQDFRSTVAYQTVIKDLRLPVPGPYILYVGSEHPRKNVKTILRTISQLKSQYPNIVLLKVGDPGLLSGRRETLRLIDDYALQNNVKLLGKVSDELLQDFYHVADALLMPSYMEGSGMPILEAMASGCPVVCSNATAIPEIAGDAAHMHDPDDVAGFTQSIGELIETPAMRKRVIRLGVVQAKKFSWNTAAQQTLELYTKFL